MSNYRTLRCRSTLWNTIVQPIAPSTTLLPFLYQTRTIQQDHYSHSSAPERTHAHPNSRRISYGWAGKNRPQNLWEPKIYHDSDYLPFDSETKEKQSATELEELEQDILSREDSRGYTQPSTITDQERAAFERLFGIAAGIKSVQQELKADNERPQKPRRREVEVRMPPVLESMMKRHGAQEELGDIEQARLQLTEEEVLPIQTKQSEEANRIETLLRTAKTDVELWDVLEREVFSVIKRLKLDEDPEPAKETSKKPGRLPKAKIESPTEDNAREKLQAFAQSSWHTLASFAPNYPTLLLLSTRQLRSSFPASSLVLNILPTVKSLGRSSYALGASTLLYNELIGIYWMRYGNFDGIISLLKEMDNGGVGFDEGTLGLLEDIVLEAKKAVRGHFGRVLGAVYGMERFRGAFVEIERWREEIGSRLEKEALRRAKKVEATEGEKVYRGVKCHYAK